MIISIGGAHGSGKSTIAKQLAEDLSWPRYYMGGLRREAAKKRGLTLAEYNKLGESDPQTDLEVDEYQRLLGETSDNFVIEGRTSWHFIPHSLKIYLDVNEEEAAIRVFSDLESRPEEAGIDASIEEISRILIERKTSDEIRYRKFFNIEVYNPENYDFYLDTSALGIEEVRQKILEFVKNNLPQTDIE
ncbi:MAG: (d)CMP kinase [Candidatus Falkowbacteria bacterium]|nr:(d)CMP kinase [Candidatus Falkowbacteria bacterium]